VLTTALRRSEKSLGPVGMKGKFGDSPVCSQVTTLTTLSWYKRWEYFEKKMERTVSINMLHLLKKALENRTTDRRIKARNVAGQVNYTH
jgi:hypothetical protein